MSPDPSPPGMKSSPDLPSSQPLAGIVAVIGCDGSGKSTLSADLITRLSAAGPVHFVYLGQSSGNIANGIRSLPLIGKSIGRYLVRRAERTHSSNEKSTQTDVGAALVIFLLSLWRVHKFRRMLKLHRLGVRIITDRYPQAEVTGFYFDGPGLDVKDAKNWLVRELAMREHRLYQWMAGHVPALVIRLNIDADTAHARKPDHKLSMLRTKLAVIPNLHFNNANILDLDGTDPYAHVLDTAVQAASETFDGPRQ